MKIMAIADKESTALWDHFRANWDPSVDLILACGDLKSEYLSYLVTLTNVPVLCVPGNHDDYKNRPPEGCIDIDNKIYVHNGIRILGLGGSIDYGNKPNMYSQEQMHKRCRKLRRQLKKYGGFDILLTHAPAYDLPTAEDYAHTGFEAFRNLLDEHKPKYMVHGHVHMNYSRRYERETVYEDTCIINAYERHSWEY